jgi:DNA invertase Pin-like site-specific DNA recombinase
MAKARSRTSQSSKPRRAITYGRVSTGRQAATGVSLGDQADTLAEYVAQRRWEHVAHATDPGLSGRKKLSDRPGLAGAVTQLDRGEADVLVAAKVDRLFRSTAGFAHLLDHAEKQGWAVVVLDVAVDTTTAAGRLVVDVVSAAAQFESRRIAERVKSTHAVRRTNGKRAGQPPALPQTVRRRIVRQRAAGRSLQAIADDLTSDGVSTAKGKGWYPSTVAHVLQSVDLDRELAEIRRHVSAT